MGNSFENVNRGGDAGLKARSESTPVADAPGYQPPKRQWSARSRRKDCEGRPTYAAIDLGTNNCRMLIAVPESCVDPRGRQQFRVVDSFSRVVRLGEGVASTGSLSEAAIERTIDALRVCAKKMQALGTRRIKGVATEACRRGDNGDAFLARVKERTGIDLETISAEEESRLALAGCAPLIGRRKPRALVFDIGGGSTEVTWVAVSRRGSVEPLGVLSLTEGVVTLAERFNKGGPTPDEYASLKQEISERLGGFDKAHGITEQIARNRVQMLGTSGTVTTLGGIRLGLPRYDRSRVDGLLLECADIEKICTDLVGMPARQRLNQPCIGPDRADLVLVGCAILEGILARWPVARLRIADRGIREGLLVSMMRDDQACESMMEKTGMQPQVLDSSGKPANNRKRRRRRTRKPAKGAQAS
ncbi:MAG: Ppx/GppA phosphatase family protein [Magnetovibrionaceae bacterium]